jgi:hypothetical protein
MTALDIRAAEPTTLVETIEIASITRDVVVRAKGTNRVTVAEYQRAMADGATFPPIVVYRDRSGVLHLSDGAHRLEATERNGGTTITAEIREGNKKDCLTHAVGSARSHGLRFSTADKRRAIELMLAAFPKMSNLKLSQLLGVDDKTVAATKARLASSEIPTPADPIEKPLARFRALLDLVSEPDRARFAEQILAMLTAPSE